MYHSSRCSRPQDGPPIVTTMVSITANRTVHVATAWGLTLERPPGVSFLMTDYHASLAPRAIFSRLEPFDAVSHYHGVSLGTDSLAIVWIAGLGDTVSLTPGLMALQTANPDASIAIITIPSQFEVLESAGFNGTFIEYPPRQDEVDQFDWLLPIEGMSQVSGYLELDSIIFFAQLLGQPGDVPLVRFTGDPDARRRMRLPNAQRPRIAVQSRGLSPIRTYPLELQSALLKMLVQRGYEVHLMGRLGDSDIVSTPPYLYNACGTTTTFNETVAYLEQMDALIAPDSFLMHLGGALEIPTVALMSSVPARLRCSRYPSITPLEPDFPCAPCLMTTQERCPEGFDDCHALRSPSMRPARVLRTLERILLTAAAPAG